MGHDADHRTAKLNRTRRIVVGFALASCVLYFAGLPLYGYMARRLGWCPLPIVWHDVQWNQLRTQLSEADLKHCRDFRTRPRMDRFKQAQHVLAALIEVEAGNNVVFRGRRASGGAERIHLVDGAQPKVRFTLSELVELLGLPQRTSREGPIPDYNIPACDWVYYDCGPNPACVDSHPQWRAPYLMVFKAARTDGVVFCVVFCREPRG